MSERLHKSTQIAMVGLLAIALCVLIIIAVVKERPVPAHATYVGSVSCESCHSAEHHHWQGSLHAKMMRRVSSPGAVVADLSPEGSGSLFNAKEAVWAIGSKWEQQFMGHDGHGETLLPGAWLVAHERWQRKGWDGWQVPVPLQRCHGCHTVGLDTETGDFVEPGIGCESCHGPGDWHVKTYGLGKIHSSLDAQVCGQCHTRGRSKDGTYFFPVAFRPGYDLVDYFREQEPRPGQNSSYWWGNGRERKRHQEYPAWKRGGHANSLKRLTDGYDGRYGKVTSQCLSCHSAEGALSVTNKDIGIEDAVFGITCAVCHNVHGQLNELRIQCADCHEGGAFYHHPERNVNHVPCPAEAKVDCVSCHMPLTILNGGGFTLRSHSPGLVPPSETAEFGVPSSCANGGCHTDRDVDWLQAVLEQHYPSSGLE